MKKLLEMTPYELGESSREEAVKYLIMFLSSGKPNDKRLAASAVGKLADKYPDKCQAAIPFLIENLSDSHGQIRQYTLKALAKLNLSHEYEEVIKHVALKDNAEYNRRAAAELLEKIKDSKTENNFIEQTSNVVHKESEEAFIDILNSKCGIKLTGDQKRAALHKNGPALVLAVPGAGKTTVLLSRTANLIINHGIHPASILSITFSKASAIDMKNRYEAFFSDITSIRANFSTIHSFCYELIRKYASLKNIGYKIIEDGNGTLDKKSLLKSIYKEFNGENIDEDALGDLINAVGYIKNMMLSIEEMRQYEQSLDIRNFSKIFSKYEEIKKANNYLDYDDMLTLSYDILKLEKAILDRYRKLYKYIQIDEGQDTSKIQHSIIELIARPNNNIFVVADDDQSIYSFRGAYPKFLLEFDKVYSGTKKIFIEENFRSTEPIVKLANKFIENNKERFKKQLHTKKEGGSTVNIVNLVDDRDQVDYILKEISKVNKKESAVLYRNNMASIRLADQLSRKSIDFYIKDYNRFFFKHFVVEDIKAFICFTLSYYDIEDFSRIYYRVNSYISKDTVQKIMRLSSGNLDVFSRGDKLTDLPQQQQGALKRFKRTFDSLKYKSPVAFIEYLERDFGYNKYLREAAPKMGYSYEGLRIILTNIKELASRCSSFVNFMVRLEELEAIMEKSRYKRENANITLSTIHSSKGLEFNNVFIVDLIENIMPTRSSIEKYEDGIEDNLEEERRLMYVAMTRAKENLHIMTVDNKNDENVKPSRFINEILWAKKNLTNN